MQAHVNGIFFTKQSSKFITPNKFSMSFNNQQAMAAY